MKTIMNKKRLIILLISIAIFILLVIGFQHRMTIITYVRYGSFFRYSLGDFTRVETERFNNFSGQGTKWVLEYQRASGESERITLRAWGLNRVEAEANFANQFMSHAREIVIDDLLRESIQEHFTLIEEGRHHTTSIGSTKREFYVSDAYVENMNLTIMLVCGVSGHSLFFDGRQARKVLNRRGGIQLYSLTPYTFFNEWEGELHIWLSTRIFDGLSDDQIQERFKLLVRDVSHNHHISVVKISFWHGEESFRGYYFLETDTFETRLWSEIHEERRAEQEAERQAEFEEFERQVLELRERFGGDIGEMHVDVSFLETLTPEQVILAEEFIFYFADLDEFGPPEYDIHFSEGEREIKEGVGLVSGCTILYDYRTRWRTRIWRTEAGNIVDGDDEDAYRFERHRVDIVIHVFYSEEVAIEKFFTLEGRKDRGEEFAFYRQVENENNTAAIIYDFHFSEYPDRINSLVAIRTGRVIITLYESHRSNRSKEDWGEINVASVAFLELFYEFLQD